MKKLYEVKHPYYAHPGNYFNKDCHTEYARWEDFVAEEDYLAGGEQEKLDSIIDMNLVYRWDWRLADPASEYEPEHKDRLLVFFVGQRKALHRSSEISIDPKDRDRVEPLAAAWLKHRWKRLQQVWEPFSTPECVGELADEEVRSFCLWETAQEVPAWRAGWRSRIAAGVHEVVAEPDYGVGDTQNERVAWQRGWASANAVCRLMCSSEAGG